MILEESQQTTRSGCSTVDDWIRLRMDSRPHAVSFHTSVYSAFLIDMQAQLLSWLGADLMIDSNAALAPGVDKLSGAKVMATDRWAL